jgi:hypothetical protein
VSTTLFIDRTISVRAADSTSDVLAAEVVSTVHRITTAVCNDAIPETARLPRLAI